MIKKLFLLLLILTTVQGLSAQTMEELEAKKAELETTLGEKMGEVNALESELAGIKKEITYLSGWNFGMSGLIGIDFAESSKWIANPNPTSSSTTLALGFTGFANREAPKYFWKNKLIINKAWQDNNTTAMTDTLGLFDQSTVDILNLSSLGGYKLTEQIALSALAELNTSIEDFLQPGTFDFGLGATWTPLPNLVVVVHPLNYRVSWSANGDASGEGAVGAKIRADYQDNFLIAGRKIAWSSTLTSFIPYSNRDILVSEIDQFKRFLDANGEVVDTAEEAQLREGSIFEITWLNSFSFQIWKGIGVGFNFGLRQADFEFQDLQSFYSLGFTYTI
ncbi:MAG: DUF3078 domain-containing protein [Bacteroidota bacterium]